MSIGTGVYRRLSFVCLTVALFIAMPTPESASAGEFSITGCDYASGATEGWFVNRVDPGTSAGGACPTGGNPLGGLFTRSASGNGDATVPTGTAARVFFNAPPGTSIVGLKASYYFARDSGRWQAALSNGAQILRGCSSRGFYCVDQARDAEIAVPGSPTIYIETFCADGPCPISRSQNDPSGLQARAQLTATEVRLRDDSAPSLRLTGGSALEDRWLGGTISVQFDASDNSGIPSGEVLLGGVRGGLVESGCPPSRYSCGGASGPVEIITKGLVADGLQSLSVRVRDRGGNETSTERTLRIDNTAPKAPMNVRSEGSSSWRAVNEFAIAWDNPAQDGTAPIAGATYEMCPASVPSASSNCVSGDRDGNNLSRITDLRLPGRGEWDLRLRLRDQAGNQTVDQSAPPIRLGYDDEAPLVAIKTPAAENPTRVPIEASDRISGIANAEVELRRSGTDAWRPIPTERTSTGFDAVVDDEVLADGVYDLRARAVDLAGNERSVDTADGKAAQIRLPVRIKTRLAVGRPKRVRLKRREGDRKFRTVLVTRPRLPYGRVIRVQGRVTTPGANPVAGAPVEVFERVDLPGSEFRPTGRVTTSKSGHFVFRVAQGPKRLLRFRYPGTSTIRPRSSEVDLRVKAATSLRPNRRSVVNGEDMVFRGRLKGGPRPPTSKLIQLQAYTRGRWATFANPRANPATGLWSFRYRFAATRGRVTYRIRARIPREASYPYETGTSRPARVRVRGL